MFLSHELIEGLKKKMNDPESRGEFRLMKDCVVQSDTAIAKHLLFEQVKEDFPNLPKTIFYIIMDELFEQRVAADGNLGYMAKFIPNNPINKSDGSK